MQRVAIIGITGVGKTHLARELAARLGLPHVELDGLYWGPDWSRSPREVFRSRLDAALRGDRWIADGTYLTRGSDITWSRADTLVWLDYRLPLVYARLARRTWQRLGKREVLWHGNRERLAHHFRDSPFLHATQNHFRHRWLVPELLGRPEVAHLEVEHFTVPRAAAAWLAAVAAGDGARELPPAGAAARLQAGESLG